MRRIEEYWYKFEYAKVEHSETAVDKSWYAAYSFIDSIKLAAVVLTLIISFVCKPFTVQGDSMNPTLMDGDRLAGWSVYNEINRGDIVVISLPDSKHKLIIKRVIAVGGDSIDIDFHTGKVLVNGEELNETYIYDKTYLSYDMQFPLTVPEGKVFVMGDNRNNSIDSRSSEIGLVDENYIVGKTVIRLSPFKVLN